MNICFDVGNSTIGIGVYENNILKENFFKERPFIISGGRIKRLFLNLLHYLSKLNIKLNIPLFGLPKWC